MLVIDTGPWRWLIYADRWLAWNTENILLGVPAILASVRGRLYIRTILLGKLRTLQVWAVGLGSGALARAYGVVVSLPVHGPPIPYLHGLSRAYDAGPFAAFFLGPVEEEFLYQIVIQGALQRFGALVAVLGASVLFTGMHFIGDGVSRYDGLLILFPTFILFGVIRQRTKSFGAAVLAHMFFNIFGACLANQH